MLKLERYDCTVAHTYDEALDAFNEYGKFDYAMIDNILKCGTGKSGDKLIQAIKKISPKTKCVLCSQYKVPPIDPHIAYTDKISPGDSKYPLEDTIDSVIAKWEDW